MTAESVLAAVPAGTLTANPPTEVGGVSRFWTGAGAASGVRLAGGSVDELVEIV